MNSSNWSGAAWTSLMNTVPESGNSAGKSWRLESPSIGGSAVCTTGSKKGASEVHCACSCGESR